MAVPPYRWNLAESPFTLLDRARIAWWVLSQDRYTMGERVKELEARFSQYSGMHAVMVANGSLANQLVFELFRVKHPGVDPVVICPAVTWISSITPQMSLGMEVVFADVELDSFSLCPKHLERLLEQYKDRAVIIWPTALIGWVPPMERYHELAARHGNAVVYLDACENTFGGDGSSVLASAELTTTSTYLSHHVTSVEGGFVFCRNEADADLARMFRNHGMVRSLHHAHSLRQLIERDNPEVDARFLFALPGTNLRASDVHAMFGLCDMERIEEAKEHRQQMYGLYHMLLDDDRYYLPKVTRSHVAFCLPVFVRDAAKLAPVKAALAEAGIDHRPVIGGCLGRQPCLKHLFAQPLDEHYPNAEWVHTHGCYVGLHGKVTRTMVHGLTDLLNTL